MLERHRGLVADGVAPGSLLSYQTTSCSVRLLGAGQCGGIIAKAPLAAVRDPSEPSMAFSMLCAAAIVDVVVGASSLILRGSPQRQPRTMRRCRLPSFSIS
jgi:hypothetical protein